MFAWNDDSSPSVEVDVPAILADNSLDDAGKSALLSRAVFDAAQNGSDDTVLKDIFGDLAASKYVKIDACDGSGGTALGYACCYGQERAVLELLRFGADPDLADANGYTPLMWAVQNQNLSVVQRLLDANASPEKKSGPDGKSALDICPAGTAVAALLETRGYSLNKSLINGPNNGRGASGTDDFYRAAKNPIDVEEQFARDAEASAKALAVAATLQAPFVAETDIYHSDNSGEDAIFGSADPFDWDSCDLTDMAAALAIAPGDLPQFLDIVISDVRPVLRRSISPVSASALFLVSRFYSYKNYQEALASLFAAIPRRVLAVLESHSDDYNYICYWLLNTGCLIYFLRRDTKTASTCNQIYLSVIEELLLSVQRHATSLACRLLDPLIKPCILNYQSIPGLTKVAYRPAWRLFGRGGGPSADAAAKAAEREADLAAASAISCSILPPSMDALMRPAPRNLTGMLSSVLAILDVFYVHPITTQEIMSQVLYWLGARLFNEVLQNKRYLARAQAMQIRLNVSAIDDWCRNNERRPSDGNEFVHEPLYKSLTELGRTHLACIEQILQWLQIFTGLGSDFTNVIAALQELKALNPCQILYAAKNYRFELGETVLSKEYRAYLVDLEKHWRSQNSPTTSSTAAKNGNTTTAGSSVDAVSDEPVVLAPIGAIPLADAVSCSISTSYKPILSKELMLDPNLELPSHIPSLVELLEYWGGGLGGVDTGSSHFFVPQLPAELGEVFEKLAKSEDVFGNHDMPQSSLRWEINDEWN